jgi:hypothetical protein
MTTKTERIKAACIAGAEAAKAGQPEEPPKGLTPHEIASWRMGWEGVVTMESPEPEPEPELEEAERQYEEFDIGDGFGPVRVPILTEEEKRRCEEMAADRFPSRPHYHVERELRELFKRFQSEHKRQPGEGSWFVFTNPEPRHAPILREFVDRNRAELETIAAERGKAYTFRAHYARAALGLMQKSQTPRQPVDRTHAVPNEWLIEAGWTPVKDPDKKGNAYRPYWNKAGAKGKVNVFAAAGGGWQVMFYLGRGD